MIRPAAAVCLMPTSNSEGKRRASCVRSRLCVSKGNSPCSRLVSTSCPAPRPVAREQRREDARQRRLPRAVRADRHSRVGGPFALRQPGEELHAPALGRHQPLARRVVRIRPARPPAGDRAVDEPRVQRLERRVVRPEVFRFAGGIRGDDHIRVRDEVMEAPSILRHARGRGRRCACRAATSARRRRCGAGRRPAGSTLTTSAPKSASTIEASPPAGPLLRSTTSRSSQGPLTRPPAMTNPGRCSRTPTSRSRGSPVRAGPARRCPRGRRPPRSHASAPTSS